MSPTARRVCVLADDLIWASRLAAAVERAGAEPVRVVSTGQLEEAVADGRERYAAVVVDLTGRRYDGVAAVSVAAASGVPVIAVGQHEDLELRRRALEAGAQRVYSYNKLFRDGPAVMGRLLAPQPGAVSGERP